MRLPGYYGCVTELDPLKRFLMVERVLRNISAMTAEREALRMDIERLTVLFPMFDFEIEHSGRTVQYKLDAQSLRLFRHHSET